MNRDSTHHLPARSRGFTLTEILIVVAIIALLASITLVVGRKAFGTADKVRLAAQLQTIERALDAYKTDFGSYPTTKLDEPSPVNYDNDINEAGYRGARLLCKALVAPTPQGSSFNANGFRTDLGNQDGYDGPGFRVPPRSGVFKVNSTDATKLEGKVYGPYLSGSSIGYGPFSPSADEPMRVDTKSTTYDDKTVLADANGNVILYYPVLNAAPSLKIRNAYVGGGPTPTDPNEPMPMYRSTDNSHWIPENDLRRLLGDVRGDGNDPDGAINRNNNDNETAVAKGKYLLISAGRDGIFGPNPNAKNNENDDVTNFAAQ